MCASPCKSLSLVNCLIQKTGKWRNICCVAAVHESAARGSPSSARGPGWVSHAGPTADSRGSYPPPPPTYTPTQARGLGVATLVPPPKAACGAVCKARVKLWCTRHVGVPALVTTPPELRRSTTHTKVLSAAVAEVHLQEANLKH